jgi:hypothetical protein
MKKIVYLAATALLLIGCSRPVQLGSDAVVDTTLSDTAAKTMTAPTPAAPTTTDTTSTNDTGQTAGTDATAQGSDTSNGSGGEAAQSSPTQ